MPNLDGTGPNGAGPMTGRGMGNCQSGMPRGGMGRGQGMRRGRCFYGNWGMGNLAQAPTLEEQAELLEDDLKAVKEEIARRKGKK